MQLMLIVAARVRQLYILIGKLKDTELGGVDAIAHKSTSFISNSYASLAIFHQKGGVAEEGAGVGAAEEGYLFDHDRALTLKGFCFSCFNIELLHPRINGRLHDGICFL
ncbi:hypothetical protein Pfo_007942 [Paulownia fortunei]|nr:hypothetical protein Pfo_007942 [Paulownia fortunei]